MLSLGKRLFLPVLIVTALLALGFIASRYASLDWLVENDKWLRETIRAQPVASWMAGFVAYLGLSLIPGTTGKSIILGWLFGLVAGVVIVNVALTAAATITFLLCRHYLQAAVQARFGFYLRPIQKHMERDGVLYLLTLRFAHAPFSFLNYAAGAGTQVSLFTFWWTTHLGLLPGNIVFVYAGTRLPTLQEIILHGPLSLLDGPLLAALAATVVLPYLGRKLVRLFPSVRHKEPQVLPPDSGDSAD